MLQNSTIRADIHKHTQVRSRAMAIIKNHLWDNEGENVQMPVAMFFEELMWAIASNDKILSDVLVRMAESDDPYMTDAPIGKIEDVDLEFVILTVALPRLVPRSEPGQD